MTEAEWLACHDQWQMLEVPAVARSERKLRLIACLCCRRIWHVIPAPEARRCVEVAEEYADGLVGREELRSAIADSMAACEKLPRPLGPGQADAINAVSRVHRSGPAGRDPSLGLAAVAWATVEALRTRRPDEPKDELEVRHLKLLRAEAGRQCDLFREVFGNPFRPADFAPWRTSTAVALARQMYEARDFSAMPILADALQDAGCTDDDVLDHCRGPGPHVRGCWVLDLVLGKA
jgi:hypothetical protein